MQLQIALDFDYLTANRNHEKKSLITYSVPLAKEMICKVRAFVDIIEVGTPFIYEYGLSAVRTLKESFPEKKILADLKIADAGYYEAAAAFKNGADIVTVLAMTDDVTVANTVEAAREFNKEVMADMVAVENLPDRLTEIDEMGADYICLHTSKDLQRMNSDPIKAFMELRSRVKKSKLALAGGINEKSFEKFARIAPDVIIVGEGLTGVERPDVVAEEFRTARLKTMI